MERRPLRLRGFDYSTGGLYFVTTCTHMRRCTLGQVDGDSMVLSKLGQIARQSLLEISRHHAAVLDAWVVMPNHVHVVVALDDGVRLGVVVATYKAAVSRISGAPRVWQRGYHDHVVRDEGDLQRIREYIEANPIRWALDPENPSRRP